MRSILNHICRMNGTDDFQFVPKTHERDNLSKGIRTTYTYLNPRNSTKY